MIETHAHIYDDQFDEDRDDMLKRAFDAGVKQIWMPNCDHETINGMLALENQYPDVCLPMIGVHPCYIKENYEQELYIVENLLSRSHLRPFPMIGEIGIDFYWDLNFVPQQEEAFIAQLRLAKKYNLPICIHSRNSKNGELNAIVRCIELIEQFGWSDLRGIFHCFSGNLEEAQRVIGLNFLLGIGGVVTFKNGGMDKVLPSVDLKYIVLETDAPYLAPVPHRGKRNEVAYIELVARRIAELKQVSFQEVVQQTTENALHLIRK
ncbi:TatD family hydrolase [Emticicia sp. BO119]|uniref:TatD family hydrolase n=1 Tax=Emticicia sp. BO119 TaxID=2757768 RepID=UPI0015F10F38|nr:TatD family hydrolase [Emticicia sp. BO119]MBA4854036.1 TatD family hydrolase [Emticicia sp. BO119]